VVAILTGEDIEGRIRPIPPIWALPGQQPADQTLLARGKATYIGQPLAVVFADTLDAARAAAAAVQIELTPLDPVLTIDAALAAVPIHAGWNDNVIVRIPIHRGDAATAMASADCVINRRFVSGRVFPLPLEGRVVTVHYDPAGPSLSVRLSTQSVHQVRRSLAECLAMPESRVRVIAQNIGGSFGQKACPCAEEIILAHAALRLERHVHWAETRAESFVASGHGRDITIDLALGVSAEGRMLALRAAVVLDKGAEPQALSIATAVTAGIMLTGGYDIPNLAIDVSGVVTNKTPTGPYRGFGMPEATFALESAVDLAARALSLDPVGFRRRNLISPERMPHVTATGLVLDSGRYAELLQLVDARMRDVRQYSPQGSRSTGGALRRGVGLAFFTEITNFGPSSATALFGITEGGFDSCLVRIDPSGCVSVFTGQTVMGQGLEQSLTAVVAERLGIPAAAVAIHSGDTNSCPYTAYGSGGSRGAAIAGSALALALDQLIERIRGLLATRANCDLERVRYAGNGQFVVPDSDPISLRSAAEIAYRGVGLSAPGDSVLEARVTYDPPGFAVSYGAVAVEVEVDTMTGEIRPLRIVFGHDCGRQLSPEMVKGQILGGTVQGLGAALYEGLTFTEDGTPRVQSMHDYPVPLALDVPPIELVHLETPSPFAINGAKGAGESGTIPVPAAIANAVRDALGFDVPALSCLPLDPQALWAELLSRRSESAANR
jgi:carbon-monoxide dehydrogenase large subunit